jgi:hypothetical protein
MKSSSRIVLYLFPLLVAAGCSSTKVTDREMLVAGKLPRPSRILVCNFVATSTDIPDDSAIAGKQSDYGTQQTAEQIALGRQLGADIAANLVEKIRSMGLPGDNCSRFRPQINDIVIRGYLLSIDEGSATKRITIGFGAGSSQLKTAVEGFQMTSRGLRKLGLGQVESGGGKSPGTALGVAGFIVSNNPAGLIIGGASKVYGEVSGNSKVEGRAKQTAEEIADVLKERFYDQGWIN